MIERILKVFSVLLLVFILSGVMEITAQEAADYLVISQVCLNNNQKSNSWIEVFNPTDRQLILERFRLSNLRTRNVLPKEINQKGGIAIDPGEYVILSADENLFKSYYGNMAKIINVEALSRIATGGFLFIKTKGADEAKGAFVRYGKDENSSKLKELAGEQTVGFSDEGKSYTRLVQKSGTGIIVSDFIESSANLGKTNN